MPWVHRQESDSSLRLFCFPFAGGSAAAFKSWHEYLSGHGIEMCAIQLPGRAERRRERPFVQMNELTSALADVLSPSLDLPFALFGHSLGAIVAYELAREFKRRGVGTPAHLFVSGHRAPHRRRSRPALNSLSDEDLRRWLGRMGGTPRLLLDDAELREMFFPMIRADLALSENYQLAEVDALSCSITAMVGDSDPLVDESEVTGWGECTQKEFDLAVWPGGHFYVREQESPLLARIVETLRR